MASRSAKETEFTQACANPRYCNRCGCPREASEGYCPECGSPEFSLEINVTYVGWVNRQAKGEQKVLF
jgi:hypothetical protein